MEKVIETEYGDAIVEFTRYDEEGKIVNEVINVFLPNEVIESDYNTRPLKAEIIKLFHNGEGYNL